MNSEHILINNIIKFSLFNMPTTIGENIKYCMYKYNITMSDWYSSFSYIDKKIDVYVNRKVDMNVNTFLTRSAVAFRRGLRSRYARACFTRLRTRSAVACLAISRGEHAICCPLVTNQWA